MSPLPCSASSPGRHRQNHLLERLIPRLVARGLRLGVLKHTHHAFDMDQPGKDSHRLRRRAPPGDGGLRPAPRPDPGDPGGEPLRDAAGPFDASALDLLLVEGFKHRRFPKVGAVSRRHRPALLSPMILTSSPS